MRTLIAAGALAWLALPAGARQIQEVGTSTTFDVGTWNIEWFGDPSNGPGNEAVQLQNAVGVIEQAGIDLWALQEITRVAAFQALLEQLGPPWTGELATSSGDGTQRIGFIWRTDVVTKRSSRHILEQFADEFAYRPPLRLEVTVTLPDTSVVVVLVTTHMKAETGGTSYDRRVAASERLKTNFDFSEANTRLVWLGDLNDELLASIVAGKTSPYQNFRTDPEDYRFLTLPLESAGECTFCGGSTPSTLDHILVSDELFRAADAGMTDRLDAVYQGFPGFLSNTSDHFPVYARLDLSASPVGIEKPRGRAGLALWPVPATDLVTVRFDRPAVLPAGIRVLDLLGRERVRMAATPGDDAVSLDLSDLAAGLYVVVTPAGSTILPVVR